jgi:hypothetical protein
MVKKVKLPIPIVCLYEGRILTRSIKVYEVTLLRSGMPYRVTAKDINYPNEVAAPYDYEYLDDESKETILKLIKEAQ